MSRHALTSWKCLRSPTLEHQLPVRSFRRYTSTSSPAIEGAHANLENAEDVTDPVMKWINAEGDVGPLDLSSISDTPLEAIPLEQTPLYLPLSTFIPRQPKQPRPSRSVVALHSSVFGHPLRRDILHACAIHHLDGLRQGPASTLTRAEVRGSGRKIRRQKGSGRARLGDIRSPMIRGGGLAFGPKPRNFATSLPRKVREMGMRVALSAKLREQSLGVVPNLEWPGAKTNDFWKRVSALGWGDRTLFVTGKAEVSEGLERSSRNVKTVQCMTVEDLTVYDALRWRRLVLDVEAVEWLEAKLVKKPKEHPMAIPVSVNASSAVDVIDSPSNV